MTLFDYLDTHFGFSCEKKPNQGEDSWCYSFHENAGIMGVFDGCGGLGAASYQKLGGKTGAYLASRAVSGGFMDWFIRSSRTEQYDLETVEQRLREYFEVCLRTADAAESKFRGSMVRLLPTTVSLWLLEAQGDRLRATSVAAGDSRNYLLCDQGLMQINRDDLYGEDAMSNIYNDGVLTNVVSADGKYTLARHSLYLNPAQRPCMMISATDGCFGYLPSPMDFELLLLETLMKAGNVDQWQARMAEQIGMVAADDQSISICALGYGTFDAMKQALLPRYQFLSARLTAMGDSIDARWEMWEEYKTIYYQLTEGGVPTRV